MKMAMTFSKRPLMLAALTLSCTTGSTDSFTVSTSESYRWMGNAYGDTILSRKTTASATASTLSRSSSKLHQITPGGRADIDVSFGSEHKRASGLNNNNNGKRINQF